MKKAMLLILISTIFSLSGFALTFNSLDYLEWPSDILSQDYNMRIGFSYDYPEGSVIGKGILKLDLSVFTIAVGANSKVNNDFDFGTAEYEFSAGAALRLGALYLAASAPFDIFNGFNLAKAPKLSLGLIAHEKNYKGESRLDISYIPNELIDIEHGQPIINETFDPKDAKMGLIFYSESGGYTKDKSAIGLSFIIEDLKSAIDNEILYFTTNLFLGGKLVRYLAGYSNVGDNQLYKIGICLNFGKLDIWVFGHFSDTIDYNNLASLKALVTYEF